MQNDAVELWISCSSIYICYVCFQIKDTGSKELSCWPSLSQLESMDLAQVAFQQKLRHPSTRQAVS